MKGLRRVVASLNVVTVLGLLGVLFIMVNFIASRRYARWDCSRGQLTALSEKTAQTLKTLTEPLTITVFYQPNHPLYELIRDQLKEYERASPEVKVEYVDPDQDIARAQQLVREFEINVTSPEALNQVIFTSGTRHKYLSDTELAEFDYSAAGLGGGPRIKAFKGEEAFTGAIISVTQTASPLVWCTDGHGEKSLDAQEPFGLSDLKRALEQQNMAVKTASLLSQESIPADVRLVVIPGPTHRFTDVEVGFLQTYLERGGSCLLLVDPLADTGLEGFLERWGVSLKPDVVVDPSRKLPFVSAANLLVMTYTQHPIVEKMRTLITLFPLARSVQPVTPTPDGVTVSPLALTSEDGWGETQTGVETFQFNEGEDLKGPVSIAVAAERLPATLPEQAGSPPLRTRLVVIGDSDFVINAQLGNAGNKDFLLGAVHWLIEQEQLIGISPKTLESIKLTLTGGQLTGIFWLSFLVLPLACILLGIGMWWLRRT